MLTADERVNLAEALELWRERCAHRHQNHMPFLDYARKVLAQVSAHSYEIYARDHAN